MSKVFIKGYTRSDGVVVESHWREVKKKIQNEEQPALLFKIAFWIEQQCKLLVTNLGIIDTGFYRNSMYVSGVGKSTYSKTDSAGKHTNKAGKAVRRDKAPERNPDNPDSIVVGFAAAYAYWLEQKHPVLLKVLNRAKAKFGGRGVNFDVKDPLQ